MGWDQLSAGAKFGIGLLDALKGVPFVGEWTDEAVGLFDERAAEALRRNLAGYEARHPWISTGSQIATAIGTTLTGAGALAKAGGIGARAAQALWSGRGILPAVGMGAAEGAVSGYGSGETPEERRSNAVVGATIGGGLSGAFAGIGGRFANRRFGRGVAPQMAEATGERAGSQAAKETAKAATKRISITPQELEQEFLNVLERRKQIAAEAPWVLKSTPKLAFEESLPLSTRMAEAPSATDEAYLRLLVKKGLLPEDVVAEDRYGSVMLHYPERASLRVGWQLLTGAGDQISPEMFDDALTSKKIPLDLLYESGATGMVLPTDAASKAKRALEQGYTEQAYHGTARSFNFPKEDELGTNTGSESARLGLFAANDPDVARQYLIGSMYRNIERGMAEASAIHGDRIYETASEAKAHGIPANMIPDSVVEKLAKKGVNIDKQDIASEMEQTVSDVVENAMEKLSIYGGFDNANLDEDLKDFLVGGLESYPGIEGNITREELEKLAGEIVDSIRYSEAYRNLDSVYGTMNALKKAEDNWADAAMAVEKADFVPGQVYEVSPGREGELALDLKPLQAEIVPFKVRTTNMHTIEDLRGKAWADIRGTFTPRLKQAIREHNPEVIKIPEFKDPSPAADHYIAVDMSAYRRPNAYFDPRLKKLAHLMAGIGAMAPSAGLFMAMQGYPGARQEAQ